ncbi:MAG: flagellar basal body rod protein FlgB [Pseudomonadota bacterium]|nr:flagellar basal body rod protein FlgB [Pseudomonadota bacterium]
MELTDLPMFGLVRQRMSWLNQRQTVLSQNIANADTPKYLSHDLKKFDFRDVIRNHNPVRHGVTMAATTAGHISGDSTRAKSPFDVNDRNRPYETAPDGNQIVLEEQMVKMNETQIKHNMMTELYRKQMRMFRTVIRGGR